MEEGLRVPLPQGCWPQAASPYPGLARASGGLPGGGKEGSAKVTRWFLDRVFAACCRPHLRLGLEHGLPQTDRNEFKWGKL